MNNLKDNKKFGIIIMAVIAVIGSIVNFYAMNLFMSDLGNMFYGVHDANIIASFPMGMLMFDFVLFEVYAFRFYYRPQYRLSMTYVYLIILASFSLIGAIFSILTGTMIYGSMVAKYPFAGYSLIMLIIHILLLAFSIFMFVFLKKRNTGDYLKRKVKPHYAFFTVFLVLLIFIAFNRFGAFIYIPFYVHWRTLYLTWPYYLSLLLPMAELIHTILYMFQGYRRNPKIGLILSSCLIAADIAIYTAIFTIGYTHPQFISAISPSLPIERLSTMPVENILFCVMLLSLAGYAFWHSLKLYLKQK